MFVFLTISLVERKCETSYLFISLFMYFWIELQKFQSRLKTKNSENIWKQISQNISCREMRFCPQSSNKLYLLQKDFSEKSFSYYHLTGTSFPRGQPHNNKSLGECQAKAKIVWAKGHQIVVNMPITDSIVRDMWWSQRGSGKGRGFIVWLSEK